jgi:hypothetical protein
MVRRLTEFLLSGPGLIVWLVLLVAAVLIRFFRQPP